MGSFVGNDGVLAPGKSWVGKANDRGKGQHQGEVNEIVKGRELGIGNWWGMFQMSSPEPRCQL